MRLWSLHPCLLDRQALVAGWREALLAQKVLEGLTRGYTRHPQLERLRAAQITTIRDLESTWNASRQFFYDSAVRYAQEQAEGHLSDDDEDEDEDGVVMGGMSATDGDDVVIVDRPPPPPALDVTSPNVEGVTVENLLRFSTRAEFVA